LAGLFLSRNALESVRGTALAEVLREAFAKLTRGMLGKIQFSWSDLDEAFSRKVVEQNPVTVKRFGEIAQSILDQRVMTFNYRKLEADKSELPGSVRCISARLTAVGISSPTITSVTHCGPSRWRA
jgi:hypothetical protein